AIDYYTKIDDPSVINDGYVFRNEAEMSWGSGSGGGSNKEVANGKVSTTGKNTGSGNGDSNTGTDIDEGNNGGEPGGNG
ncbi:collagen binding domain-containing protein, partial [Levilactobacillus spicheri]